METMAKLAEDLPLEGADEPPTIDLSGIDGPERREIGRKISEACEMWGFFKITNHGADESLMTRTKEVFTQFFLLPEEEKMKIRANPQNRENYANEGYCSPRGATDNTLLKATEYLLNIYGTGIQAQIDRQPSNPPSFRSTVGEYVEAMDAIARKLLGLMSEELGLPQETLHQYMAKSHPLRVNYYQPSGKSETYSTVPSHTDPSGLTLLLSDETAGTQIKNGNRWVPITPIPCALLVNVSDQLEILSNGRFKSVEHRGNPAETQCRLSIATFTGPEMTTVIGPLPELIDESHPPLYKTMPYVAFLDSFVQRGLDSNAVIQDAKLASPPT